MHRLKKLPFKQSITSVEIYKHLSEANIYLGELKGILDMVANPDTIIKLISIEEAKTSCEIENISSPTDAIIKELLLSNNKQNDSQDIINYIQATKILYETVLKKKIISIKDISFIQHLIEPDKSGFRLIPGYKIYNKTTNDVIHVPPQKTKVILNFYKNLVHYINNDIDEYDPLIKMSLIHYQFECIHPYSDGNGRVGRIINIIYLVLQNRLTYPILNLSRYLKETKEVYFELLTKCHNDITYLDEFVLYILKGIKETARYTINFIHQIIRLKNQTDIELQKKLPKIYSKEIVDHIYLFMFTKNELFRNCLGLSRTTATKYLKELTKNGFLTEEKIGRVVIYKNAQCSNLFTNMY